MRDRVRVYAHAHSPDQAKKRIDSGYTAVKTGGVPNLLANLEAIRTTVGDEIDLMVDVHGPPWMTTADAISMGKKLGPFNLTVIRGSSGSRACGGAAPGRRGR